MAISLPVASIARFTLLWVSVIRLLQKIHLITICHLAFAAPIRFGRLLCCPQDKRQQRFDVCLVDFVQRPAEFLDQSLL